jgi:hypothetical protein
LPNTEVLIFTIHDWKCIAQRCGAIHSISGDTLSDELPRISHLTSPSMAVSDLDSRWTAHLFIQLHRKDGGADAEGDYGACVIVIHDIETSQHTNRAKPMRGAIRVPKQRHEQARPLNAVANRDIKGTRSPGVGDALQAFGASLPLQMRRLR